MKKLVKVPVKVVTEEKEEVRDEEGGLIKLLGKRVCIMCCNYIYSGKLVGVNSTCVALEEAGIVYQTGPWSDASWKDIQRLPSKTVYVQLSAAECFFSPDSGK